MRLSPRAMYGLLLATAAVSVASQLHAELLLETLVVELNDDDAGVEDVEIYNDGDERMFVSVEPSRIEKPGLTSSRITDPDPEALGLLASPSKLILEPGQRKLIRLASLSNISDSEEVYRVLVRPVPAPDEPDQTGLNIMVGYDLLVLVRPEETKRALSGEIENGALTVRNLGNASLELLSGEVCTERTGDQCAPLPGKRLYADQSWTVPVEGAARVKYFVKYADGVDEVEFLAMN